MVITIDAPEITTEYVNRPIEALILDKRAAGQDEYTNASVEALLPEAVATNKEAIATEALKVAPSEAIGFNVQMVRDHPLSQYHYYHLQKPQNPNP
jgi:hypothetical protein